MAFGAFAPMPLRLGGTAEDGWSPGQHARMACDVAAMYSVKCFAILTYTVSGSTVTVHAYNGRDGVGVSFAPTPTVNSTGNVTWTWAASWEDSLETTHVLAFSHARASTHGTAPTCGRIVSASGRTCRVATIDLGTNAAADCKVTLRVWSVEKRRREHYGGCGDKRESRTEGRSPYAWGWYQHYQAAMGSAYSDERGNLTHAENLADARAEAGMSRAAEKLVANSTPNTSDEKLSYWATVQSIRYTDSDLTHDVRARCSAKYKAAVGPNLPAIESACEALLGNAFVQLRTIEGSALASPPVPTYWPGVNPGPASHDLGGGAWFSSRAHLVVETAIPQGYTDAEFLRLMNVHLFNLLDDTLPSYATFNWGTGITDGFILDVSRLDFTGFGFT